MTKESVNSFFLNKSDEMLDFTTISECSKRTAVTLGLATFYIML